jgi:hypothetical protein
MLMKALEKQLCYLCGKTLTEPSSKDHVPLKALFPPEIRKKHKPTKLVTLRVHKACNESYHFDEQYFIYSLYPFALATYVGDAMRKHIREKFRARENQKLVAMMMAEFDPRPGGLVLSDEQVVKRFESVRIERVLWKIVRGLHFHHRTQVLPANWSLSWTLTTPQEPGPPEHFKLFRDLPGNEPLGDYPGVFTVSVW